MDINPKVIQWFEGRGIGPETVAHMQIYSGQRCRAGACADGVSVVEATSGNIICFPYTEKGVVVAEKYRTADKKFWQRKNGRKTLYNVDVLDDPSLAQGTAALVITEGEMDALALLESGYPWSVSVPDGAPPARDANGNLIPVPDGMGDIDPATDEKFRCIFNNVDRLSKVKRIVVATDADEPGRRLAAELVRRLGRVRCWFVSYPEDCKDFNDVLMKHGRDAVLQVVDTAKPYPFEDVFVASQVPDEPDVVPVPTGWGRLDPHFRLFYPSLVVVTGLAGHGKTSFTTQLAVQVAKIAGWRFGVASFEMRLNPYMFNAIKTAFLEKPRSEWTMIDHDRAARFLDEYFCFISPETKSDVTHDIDWLIDRAKVSVIRYGVRGLIIDPWNEIEHCRRRDESLTEYTGRAIRELKMFARDYDACVITVAHPTKSGAEKAPERMGLYDISDSSHFANKADHGIVVARMGGEHDHDTAVMVRKVRYQPETGQQGTVTFTFDTRTKLFGQ